MNHQTSAAPTMTTFFALVHPNHAKIENSAPRLYRSRLGASKAIANAPEADRPLFVIREVQIAIPG